MIAQLSGDIQVLMLAAQRQDAETVRELLSAIVFTHPSTAHGLASAG